MRKNKRSNVVDNSTTRKNVFLVLCGILVGLFLSSTIVTFRFSDVNSSVPLINVKSLNYCTKESIERNTFQLFDNSSDTISATLDKLLPHNLPFVSVIIPCYNKGSMIVETALSIVDQTYKNFEMIIVDDGSTDKETIEALSNFESAYNQLVEAHGPQNFNLKILRKSNGGLSSARNYGANFVDPRSQYIVFIDHDDLLERHAISLMVLALYNNPDVDYVYPDQWFFGDISVWWRPQEYNAFDLLWANHPSVCSIIKRSVFDRVNYATNFKKGMEDWFHWLELSTQGYKGKRLKLPIFKYRVSSNSMSKSTTIPAKREIYNQILDSLSQHYEISSLLRTKLEWRPLISVIIPYCFGNYFEETFYSVKNQTIQDIEVIIVNNCEKSTYHSQSNMDRLNDFKKLWPDNVKLIDRTRYYISDPKLLKSPASARNLGASESRGDFLLFLDEDDILEKTALEKLWILFHFSAHQPSEANFDDSPDSPLFNSANRFVYPGVYHFGEGAKDITQPFAFTEFNFERLKVENFLTVTALIDKNLFFSTGGFDEDYVNGHEDYDFWLKLASLGVRGHLLREPLFHYRRKVVSRVSEVNQKTSSLSDLKNRNPAFFSYELEEHLPHYSPIKKNKFCVVEQFFDFVEKDYSDNLYTSVPREDYRRTNEPLRFFEEHWTGKNSHKKHILYLIPFMTVGGSEVVDIQILEGLHATNQYFITLFCELPNTHAWRSRFENIVDEIFFLPYLIDQGSCPCPVLYEYKMELMSYFVQTRNIDVIFNRNTYIGYQYFKYFHEFTVTNNYEKHIQFIDLIHLYTPSGAWEQFSVPYHSYIDQRIVISNDLKDHLVKINRNQDPNSIRVIYNGLDLSQWDYNQISKGTLRKELHLNNDHIIIGLVARLEEQKNPLLWLEIAKRIITLDPSPSSKFRFVIIGDGSLRVDILNFIILNEFQDKIFLLVDRDNIAPLMIDFDLMLLTSQFEGIPIVLLEAMSLGIPIVSTDVGGIRELVINDGVNCVLLPSSSTITEYTNAIFQIVYFKGVKKDSINRVRTKFSKDAMVNNYVELFDQFSSAVKRRQSQRYHDYLIRQIDKEAAVHLTTQC